MIPASKILLCVAGKFAVDVGEITGRSRLPHISDARFFFCLITRQLTRMSYSSIGKYINRHHATVIHGEKRAGELMDVYPEMKTLYNEIINEITMDQIM